MRLLAIGDIHGCSNALKTLARMVPFRHDDELVFLGDIVDRGPDTRGVINWFLNFDTIHKNWTLLRGNHEIMMLRARSDPEAYETWYIVGGDAVIESYGDAERFGNFDDIPERHWHFLDKTPRKYHETDSHLFVHANLDAELPLIEQPDEMLFWERFDSPTPHVSGKTMICGHTAHRDGWPKDVGHAICIDTCVYGQGYLTCFDVYERYIWQASEYGEIRRGYLADGPDAMEIVPIT